MLLKTCFVCSLLMLLATCASVDAGVLRQENLNDKGHVDEAVAATATPPSMISTKSQEDEAKEATNAHTKDEQATIELMSINDDFNATDAAAVEPPMDEETTKNDEQNAQMLRSAKLLLLSTPKLHERMPLVEANQADEAAEEGSGLVEAETTEEAATTTDATAMDDDTTTMKAENTELDAEAPPPIAAAAQKSAQLLAAAAPDDDDIAEGALKSSYQQRREDEAAAEKHKMAHAIEDAEFKKLNEKEAEAAQKTATACNTTASVADQVPETPNDNIDAAIIIVAENVDDDFVIVDAASHDELADFNAEYVEGSFTHADSAEHLQPIVQSVEIVPPSLDEKQIVSFVGSW